MTTKKHPHPGAYIKTRIPQHLSVTEAADFLLVGRPAFSNLLNGNADLSYEMAVRLEKAFGLNKEELLLMQKNYDEQEISLDGLIVKNYIPPFLVIKSRQISEWAKDDIDARVRLAILLRKLIHSTTPGITSIDFPGYDDAQKKGWDGEIDSEAATPWVPKGKSSWEFGCTKDMKKKAEDDFKARTKSVPEEVRLETTFVFVTPHKWDDKKAWTQQKSQMTAWKSVRAIDASDLEQWIEQSIPAQGWLAEQIGQSATGVQSIENYWQFWSDVTKPALNKNIFNAHIKIHSQQLLSWLAGDPETPLIIKADSIDEGLAFLSCIFDIPDFIKAGYKDRVIIFRSQEAFQKLSAAVTNFIPVIYSEDVEKEIGGTFKKKHTILIHPKNLNETSSNVITLDALGYDAFNDVLKSIGIAEDEFDKYTRQSGRSITVLRRRLTEVEAIKRPEWTKNEGVVRSIIPMVFAGSWANNLEGDVEIIKKLSDVQEYKEIEKSITALLRYDDCPIWSVGYMTGAVSKIDSLFAIHSSVTKSDLENFFTVAELVLSEIDPALELPEDQRWAANIYGKTRNHSNAIKNGICETLVILSIHGNTLFQKIIGDVETRVGQLIRRLLTPLDEKRLLSQNNNLPFYAEAAPMEFLKIIRQDLKAETPVLSVLMQPVRYQLMGTCYRTSLLWALELLAWNTDYLMSVCKILAQLTHYQINDNWVNKPYNSLHGIFRSWMPQTSASLTDRKKTLELLMNEFPEVGFKVCVNLFDQKSSVGEFAYKPRWRSDATGFGNPVSRGEARDFIEFAIDLAIDWHYHDENSFGELIEGIEWLTDEQQMRLWDAVIDWTKRAPDSKKVILRETIREFALTKRGSRRIQNEQVKIKTQEIYELLAPHDLLNKHQWLFKKIWVQLNYDEVENEDYIESQKKIEIVRTEALREIWNELGLQGIITLLTNATETEGMIGWLMAKDDVLKQNANKYLLEILRNKTTDLENKVDAFLYGFFQGMEDKEREKLHEKFSKKLSNDELIRILTLSPANSKTWRLVNTLNEELQNDYWQHIKPTFYTRLEVEEINTLITKLINANRPNAAFQAVHLDFEKINSKLLFELLHAIPTRKEVGVKKHTLDSYYVIEVLNLLNDRKEISETEMASLEFLYAAFLSHTEYKLPNLQNQMAKSPSIFMEILRLLYRREDNQDDREINAKTEHFWQAAYSILHQIKFLPGKDETGKVSEERLQSWIEEFRNLCKENSRVNVGDSCLGELIANAPKGKDGIWPCEEVREVLEKVINPKIASGIATGIYNSRGVIVGADGGASETLLFNQYIKWSNKLAIDYPLVSDLLRDIALDYKHDAQRENDEENIRRRLEF